ncbi:hypothetical protein WJ96_06380 [Burkholderia ubonensis]|uniref:VWFA domain-containing protein n=1 Tax=Burkholderia ubonensis TaxID=101571 RepID=A0AAW3MYC7_9BURK|nr:VWA domain-containing protein [Burkholderia ubonensis]KVP75385.1 hypothetical protein WJ93_08185 [Burkholderia ubonensis]KVP96849.1 hypothetical protein WJ97_13295 [Burkholderia ubonensis]KVP98196.1 hypothetical protein WJ96_06380 [Burkholderia ubonensis]KVZ92894.1 hypothetical protein WL25_18045 [Burkholderia ubonensis]
MALTLNLEKSAQALILSLEKAGIKVPHLDVGFAMDVSGSFEDEHEDGTTELLLTRLVPWGLTFDPDKKLDVFTFSNGRDSVQDVGPIDARNYQGFVRRNIIGVKGYNGGTAYSHVLESFLEHFGWKDVVKKAGFFGSLMGKKDEVIKGERKPSLVIIATDGDNNESGDKERTMRVLRESEARKDQVYFLFLGISNQGSTFPFLETIGDQFSNTGFVRIPDLRKFNAMDDDALNEYLIGDELLAWFKAQSK